jgi:hypothetical protein
MTRTESLEHLVYAPVPIKGYAIRAKSPGAVEEEFREATKDWFVPFDETLYSDYSYESRVINAPFGSKKIFLSRIFRRPRLDDLGRDGQVCHMAAVPQDLLRNALALTDVDNALAAFEDRSGLPIGMMQTVEVVWEGMSEGTPASLPDRDLEDMKDLVPQDSARKFLDFVSDSQDTKVYVVYKRGFLERIKLAFMLSKFLFQIGLASYTVTSDCPMETVLNYFSNVVISDYLPHLKPNSNWKILNLTPSGSGVRKAADAKKVDETFKSIYGS